MRYYLDFNVINDCYHGRNPKILQTVINAKNLGHNVVYSPAHIEEIANELIYEDHDGDDIVKQLEFLSNIADNNELISRDGLNVLCEKEDPRSCMERVVEKFLWNQIAEHQEYSHLTECAKNEAEPIYVNNMGDEDLMCLLNKQNIVEDLIKREIIKTDDYNKALAWDFSTLQNSFYIFEAFIDLSMKRLDEIGYFREKLGKYRSKLHDTTHIIYASYSDYFITKDKRLQKRASAIFNFFNVATEILTIDDFLGSLQP